MNKYKKPLIIGGIIIAAIVLYFLFFRKKDALAAVPAINSDDEAAYQEMYRLLEANIDKTALYHWLGDLVKDAYTSGDIHPDYLVNGKVTKTGALLATYARAYYGYGYKNTMKETDLNSQLYGIFYNLKGKSSKL